MTRFTWRTGVLAAVATVVAVTPTRTATAGNPVTENAVVRMQVIGTAGTSEGTCFLVRNDRVDGGVVQYFVTAAHLFGPALVGEQSAESLRIRLMPGDGSTVEVNGTHALFPTGVDTGVDIAVIRLTVPSTRMVPVALAAVEPVVGTVFMIRGPNTTTLPAAVERVRFHSSRLVMGDRDIANIGGLVGAPALTEQGAFGITSDFGPTGTPIIALVSSAREFFNRALPGWDTAPAARPTFHLDRRSVEGPLLTVACDATSRGDLEVPLPLGRSERIVGAEATLSSRTQLHLGDLTILKFDDHSVTLHFTLTGMPHTFPGGPCPPGQTLVTIQVDVLSVPRR